MIPPTIESQLHVYDLASAKIEALQAASAKLEAYICGFGEACRFLPCQLPGDKTPSSLPAARCISDGMQTK